MARRSHSHTKPVMKLVHWFSLRDLLLLRVGPRWLTCHPVMQGLALTRAERFSRLVIFMRARRIRTLYYGFHLWWAKLVLARSRAPRVP